MTNSKPILFNVEMVRAILTGDKTQTRRPIKPQPPDMIYQDGQGLWYPTGPWAGRDWRCPFGVVGDVLWVRETWLELNRYHRPPRFSYRADITDSEQEEIRQELGYKWRPSIHMPRWASRLTLRIKRVWVEQIQDISHPDALVEGIDKCAPYNNYGTGSIYRDTFAALWDSIYAAKGYGWDANPYVWACEFERIEQ